MKGKRNVNWKDVEQYLKKYVGECYVVESTKAKANAAQGLPEIIQIAEHKQFEENRKNKHNKDDQFGWYRYESRFALPVFNENGDIERYNMLKGLFPKENSHTTSR